MLCVQSKIPVLPYIDVEYIFTNIVSFPQISSTLVSLPISSRYSSYCFVQSLPRSSAFHSFFNPCLPNLFYYPFLLSTLPLSTQTYFCSFKNRLAVNDFRLANGSSLGPARKKFLEKIGKTNKYVEISKTIGKCKQLCHYPYINETWVMFLYNPLLLLWI